MATWIQLFLWFFHSGTVRRRVRKVKGVKMYVHITKLCLAEWCRKQMCGCPVSSSSNWVQRFICFKYIKTQQLWADHNMEKNLTSIYWANIWFPGEIDTKHCYAARKFHLNFLAEGTRKTYLQENWRFSAQVINGNLESVQTSSGKVSAETLKVQEQLFLHLLTRERSNLSAWTDDHLLRTDKRRLWLRARSPSGPHFSWIGVCTLLKGTLAELCRCHGTSKKITFECGDIQSYDHWLQSHHC